MVNMIQKLWSADTAHPSYRSKWSKDNPSLGQCVVTALLVQDMSPNVAIYKCKVGKHTHYYNRVGEDGDLLDLTAEQFKGKIIDYEHESLVSREQLLKCGHVKERYELLKNKIIKTRC